MSDISEILPIRDLADLRRVRGRMAGKVALVPTMGALHAGHLHLVRQAKNIADHVIASIYVNPLQFGDASDLARYPRDEEGDLAALQSAGCDAAWLPDNSIMYPPGDATVIEPTGPAEGWEGTERPGHFRGVATVVAKLFGQVRPDLALFGEKDWQQLQVIKRFTADLFLPVQVMGVTTQRDHDGLALSSRNRFLTPSERTDAALLPQTLSSIAAAIAAGNDVAQTLSHGKATLEAGGMRVDYLVVTAADTLKPVDTVLQNGEYRLLAAARLGSIRLLDNIGIQLNR